MASFTSPFEAQPFDDELDAGWSGATSATLTIAVVGQAPTRSGTADVVTRLAQLAVTDELLVVYALDDHEQSTGPRVVVAGLRILLPRHSVVTLNVSPFNGSLDPDGALLEELMEIGSTPIVLTPRLAVPAVVGELCDRLAADSVLSMACTATGGVEFYETWRRMEAACSGPTCTHCAA